VTGCAWTGKHAGVSAYNDQNVLTGGPVIGTTVKKLPQPVKDTLVQRVPAAEISDIKKQNWNGRTVYKVRFLDKTQYPVIYVGEDGKVDQPPSK
jgi:hypothetical protein